MKKLFENTSEKIIESNITEIFHNSMMPYAEHVILDRVIPRVEDGLKPVQRRILYAMYEMGLTPDKPHRKCAKIVGDCLGKYHPHGDSSVYDALVRMAQDFNMRETLIDGHGNFGSIDGDGAAAYRYTEARLTALSLELLNDIDKNTVNFSLNFDDTLTEPDTLPGHFPNLLVNGCVGIAVGLSTEIPTHNLGESIDGAIAYIENPKITLDEMLDIIKGPDFPTGGIVLAGEDKCLLKEAYGTGRGKIKIRAKTDIEKAGDRENIVITEIPFRTNKAKILASIAELKEKKVAPFDDIAEVVDESDRTGMRAVIKVKSSGNAQLILNKLFQKTDLESTYGYNMVAIADGKPKQLGLLEMLKYYTDYQINVILRRSKFDLERAKERKDIIEGLIVAVNNIDEVIKIIRGADNTSDAKTKLMTRFNLSQVQAQAILDLRLARLTKLEVIKLEEELRELEKLIKELTAIIGSKRLQQKVVIKELTEIKKKYNSERKTKIVCIDIENIKANEPKLEEVKKIENYKIGITAEGTLKKLTVKSYSLSDTVIGENTPKSNILVDCVNADSTKKLYIFTSLGNTVKVNVDLMNESRFSDKGRKLRDLCPECADIEKPIKLFVIDESSMPVGHLMFFTSEGKVKKTPWSEYTLKKSFYQAIKMKDGETLINVEEDMGKDYTFYFVTESGLCLNARKEGIPEQGRVAGGVAGINLTAGDNLVMATQISDEGEIALITKGGLFKRVICAEFKMIERNRKGMKIVSLSGGNDGILFAKHVLMPYDVAVVNSEGKNFIINTEAFPICKREDGGKKPKNKNKTGTIVSAYIDLQSK